MRARLQSEVPSLANLFCSLEIANECEPESLSCERRLLTRNMRIVLLLKLQSNELKT